jgi:putative transposase
LAIKSVKQRFSPSEQILSVMEQFRLMTNDCIRIGLRLQEENNGNTPSMRKLSLVAYRELQSRYPTLYSRYSLCAISKAAGILSARRKSLQRGIPTREPYLSKQVLTSCYGFKVERSNLVIHIGSRTTHSIPLNAHTLSVLSDPLGPRVRSFTITTHLLSLCIRKEVKETEPEKIRGVIGIDRNESNITAGSNDIIVYFGMAKSIKIAENTRSIVRSFKRNDHRIRKILASKYGERRSARVRQLIHHVSNAIVAEARATNYAIAFENITGIKRLYMRGNGKSRSLRARMNSWPYGELKRQVEYKASWAGVPLITLTRQETKGTTMDCPRCGERLQVPVRADKGHYRQLWCEVCQRWWERDTVAVLNISRRGWLRFDHSQGGAGEAVRGNPRGGGSSQEPVILRVDASKLGQEPHLWLAKRP